MQIGEGLAANSWSSLDEDLGTRTWNTWQSLGSFGSEGSSFESFSFGLVTARYLRVRMLSHWGAESVVPLWSLQW